MDRALRNQDWGQGSEICRDAFGTPSYGDGQLSETRVRTSFVPSGRDLILVMPRLHIRTFRPRRALSRRNVLGQWDGKMRVRRPTNSAVTPWRNRWNGETLEASERDERSTG